MSEIDDFVEFLIRENCEGCEECEPRLPAEWKPNFACMNEGRAKWFLDEAERYKTSKKGASYKHISGTEWEHFRDNYCSHQGATIRFDSNGHCSNNKDDSFKKGCAFKNENTAHCWDDWQICNYENCPLIKYLKENYNNETSHY